MVTDDMHTPNFAEHTGRRHPASSFVVEDIILVASCLTSAAKLDILKQLVDLACLAVMYAS